MIEEWFMFWLLFYLTLLAKVWQRSGSCCYIVYNYCVRFDREWLMMRLLYCLQLLLKVWHRSGSCCGCYIIYHYSLKFHRVEVNVVAILSTITVYGLTEEWFMLLLYFLPLLLKVWQRSGSFCGCYIAYHYCLRFDRGVVHVVVVIFSTITV